MSERHNRRWPGFAMLGVLATVCLGSNVLIWWLVRQPMAVQPPGIPFVIDLQWIGQAVWGIIFVQPAIFSVYLAYARPKVFIRVAVTVIAFLILGLAHLLGWQFLSDPASVTSIRDHEFFEFAMLFASQLTGLSLAMWASRIMRGWHLGEDEETVEANERPMTRREMVVETVVLILLSTATILGFDFLTSEPVSVAGFYFAIFGLVGAVVVAPVAFFSLRFRRFAVVGPALLLLLLAIPVVMFGFLSGIEFLSEQELPFNIWLPIVSAFCAAVMLAAVLVSIRLAGYRLQQRPFEKKQIAKAPVDPFSD